MAEWGGRLDVSALHLRGLHRQDGFARAVRRGHLSRSRTEIEGQPQGVVAGAGAARSAASRQPVSTSKLPSRSAACCRRNASSVRVNARVDDESRSCASTASARCAASRGNHGVPRVNPAWGAAASQGIGVRHPSRPLLRGQCALPNGSCRSSKATSLCGRPSSSPWYRKIVPRKRGEQGEVQVWRRDRDPIDPGSWPASRCRRTRTNHLHPRPSARLRAARRDSTLPRPARPVRRPSTPLPRVRGTSRHRQDRAGRRAARTSTPCAAGSRRACTRSCAAGCLHHRSRRPPCGPGSGPAAHAAARETAASLAGSRCTRGAASAPASRRLAPGAMRDWRAGLGRGSRGWRCRDGSRPRLGRARSAPPSRIASCTAGQ